MFLPSIRSVLLFCALSMLMLPAFGQKEEVPKVLFVGNSYTYFWNLPQHVAAMAAAKEIPLETRQSTRGGASLGLHWRNGRGVQSNSLIQSGDFDYVVLQDHSLRAIQHPDSLLLFGERYGQMIRKAGAQPILYLTWARRWDASMQEPITKGYRELAEKIDARIAPVGPAWAKAREQRADIELYDPDGSHPSPAGTYLSACVFYAILAGESPVGLPRVLTSQDANGDPLYLNILPEKDATFLQQIAAETVQVFQEK